MKTIFINYCGMEGSGPTVKDAKQDAARKLTALVEDSRQPEIVRWQTSAMLVYRDRWGWHDAFIVELGDVRERIAGNSGHSYEDAIASAVARLAQAHWEQTETDSPLWNLISRREDRRRAISDYIHWRGFQRAYRVAPADLGDCQKHRWACDHAHEFAA